MALLRQVLTSNNAKASFNFSSLLQIILWLLLVGILTIVFFLEQGTLNTHPVFAAVSTLEAPERILYRSEQTLNDTSGKSWQAILFKDISPNRLTSLELRLMGCSGAAELIHSQPLKITTNSGKVLTARDVFLEEAPAPTIGQYKFEDILPQLTTEKLLLSLPVGRERFINIEVPPSVVQEWQELAAKTPSSEQKLLRMQ